MNKIATIIAQGRHDIARMWADAMVMPTASRGDVIQRVDTYLDQLIRALQEASVNRRSRHDSVSRGLTREYLVLHDAILARAEQARARVTLREVRELGMSMAASERGNIAFLNAVDETSWFQAKEHAEKQLALASGMARLGFFSFDVAEGALKLNAQMQADWQLPSPCTLDAALQRLHPDDRERVAGLVDACIHDGKPYETDYRLVLPNGTIRTIEARGTTSYDVQGNPLQFFGTVRDVSAQAGQRAWLQCVLNELPMPLIMVEPGTGSHVFSNRAADEMYGSTIPKATDPATYGDCFHITDAQGHRLGAADVPSTRAARGEVVDKEEYVWHTPQGRFDLVVSARQLPAMGAQEAMVLFAFQDVTAVKATQQDLHAAVARLQDEASMREHFVSALSHDLRTPLAAASLAAQSLTRHAGNPARLEKSVRRITASLGRVESMIRDILDANRLRAGEPLALNREACQLQQLLCEAVADLQQLHGERIALRTPCAQVTGAFDAEALRRVVDNLVSNAVKYGDESSPIELSLNTEGQTVFIAVHNEGTPIAAKDQKTLFEPYYRTASARRGKHKGWGIGLALVREISEAHGGSVQVSSSAATGTTFTVRLPSEA